MQQTIFACFHHYEQKVEYGIRRFFFFIIVVWYRLFKKADGIYLLVSTMPLMRLQLVQMRQIIQWMTETLTQRYVAQRLGYFQSCKSHVGSLCDEWYNHILCSFGMTTTTHHL